MQLHDKIQDHVSPIVEIVGGILITDIADDDFNSIDRQSVKV